jgi:FkbM family methyltransferase
MKKFFINIYRFIFCRAVFIPFNLHIYKLALRGIGVLNSEGSKVTGEKYFLEKIIPKLNIKTIVDVGANTGDYCLLIKKYLPMANIYACEPHPETFCRLEKNTKGKGIKAFNLGFSDKARKAKLWDFAEDADLKHTQPTSTLSSVYKDVIEKIHKQKSQAFIVKLTTIDSFTKKQSIKNIDFLIIDTEGSEYKVLMGAKEILSRGRIKVILFEVNEMNVYSRVFFKDFIDLLKNYKLYRLMPKGFLPITDYEPKIHEIFAFQNIVAINKGVLL